MFKNIYYYIFNISLVYTSKREMLVINILLCSKSHVCFVLSEIILFERTRTIMESKAI